MLSAYEERNKNFFRNFEICWKLPAFLYENCEFFVGLGRFFVLSSPAASQVSSSSPAPCCKPREWFLGVNSKASKHTLPCCESGEQHPRINSGQALDKLKTGQHSNDY